MERILKIFIGLLLFCTVFSNIWHEMPIDNLALVVNPVIDVSLCPLEIISEDNVENIYCDFPYAPEKGDYACARFHQLLFNEVVKIKNEFKNEAECEVFSMFYNEGDNSNKSCVWTLKKNLIKFKDLLKNGIDISKIPFPYTKDRNKSLNNILTLVEPWQDARTRVTYSVGTRFVRDIKKDTKTEYAIYIFDPVLFKIHTTYIDKSLANVIYPEKKEIATKLYISKLSKLARDSKNNFVPYVWGGCSCTLSLSENNFSMVNKNKYGNNVTYWVRPEVFMPCPGFDCSGLILRTAQLYGIPYFYKNTSTILNNMEPLKDGAKPQEGDLLCYSGHVFIVSNVKDNKLIEAAGYKAGFGKVHELTLSQAFRGINTFEELMHFAKNKIPLERIDVSGQTIRTIYSFSIYPFLSIW